VARCVECLRLLCFRRPANQPVINSEAGMSLFRAIPSQDGRVLYRRPVLNRPSQARAFASGTWPPVVPRKISEPLWKRGTGRVWPCNG
jgi:hypothetical protein